MLTASQVAAAGRHVASYAAGAVTAAAAFHLLSTQDAATLQTSVQQITNGVSEIAAGLGPIIALLSGFYATWSASHKQQVKAVASVPGTTVITTPEIAAATPETNIVSNQVVKAVPK